MKDKRGVEVDTDNPECVALIDEFVDGFMSYKRSLYATAKRAVDADSECSVSHLMAVVARVFSETEHQEQAEAHMVQARRIVERKLSERRPEDVHNENDDALSRSSKWLEALTSLRRGLVENAILIHRQIAHDFPKDVLSIKLCQIMFLNLGDKEGILDIVQTAIDRDATVLNDHFVHGLLAFGLVECDRFDEALHHGRLGVEIAPDRCDPWVSFSPPSLLLSRGGERRGKDLTRWNDKTVATCRRSRARSKGAIGPRDRMDGETFSHMGRLQLLHVGVPSFLFFLSSSRSSRRRSDQREVDKRYTHNWWHTALFYLEKGDPVQTLNLFDQRVWGFRKEHTQVHPLSFSLLFALVFC